LFFLNVNESTGKDNTSRWTSKLSQTGIFKIDSEDQETVKRQEGGMRNGVKCNISRFGCICLVIKVLNKAIIRRITGSPNKLLYFLDYL